MQLLSVIEHTIQTLRLCSSQISSLGQNGLVGCWPWFSTWPRLIGTKLRRLRSYVSLSRMWRAGCTHFSRTRLSNRQCYLLITSFDKCQKNMHQLRSERNGIEEKPTRAKLYYMWLRRIESDSWLSVRSVRGGWHWLGYISKERKLRNFMTHQETTLPNMEE